MNCKAIPSRREMADRVARVDWALRVHPEAAGALVHRLAALAARVAVAARVEPAVPVARVAVVAAGLQSASLILWVPSLLRLRIRSKRERWRRRQSQWRDRHGRVDVPILTAAVHRAGKQAVVCQLTGGTRRAD